MTSVQPQPGLPWQTAIDGLIEAEQFVHTDQEKELLLLPIIRQQLAHHAATNPHIRSWLGKLNVAPDEIQSLAQVPVLPVQMFKFFDLETGSEPLQRVLHSSGTTGQTTSRIPICRITAQRQTKALLAIIKNHFGNRRRPFLVIDSEDANPDSAAITARGAAIRGFSLLAREQVYAFDTVDGKLVFNRDRVVDFFTRHHGKEIFALGFTFIIWSEFLTALGRHKLSFDCPGFHLLHGGGWKKLSAQSVSKEVFSATIGQAMGCKPKQIMDYYGMVEQVGIVFIDCPAGHKHSPNFAEVKIRNFLTLKENGSNQPGYIEVMSVLPESYPGMSIITEDVGEILGENDCPCGRKGKYFVFRSRVEKSEARGCGDTFRET